MATVKDITERKRAEEELEKAERHLRSTVDGLSAHIVVVDECGGIILTNKSYRDFAERNGIEPRAVSEGTNYLAVCDTASGEHSEEAKPFAEGIREMLSGKRQSFELEYPCHSPDEKRWFIGRVTLFAGEGPRRVIVAHENITERRQAEEDILHSRRQRELILNSAAEGIMGLDLQGNHTFVNPAAARMLGYTVEELIGRPSHSLWHHTTPEGNPYPEEECPILTTYRNGQVHRVATEVFWRKDGTSFPADYGSTPITEQGRVLGAVVTFVDISEQKRKEDALRESERRFMDVFYSSVDSILLIGDSTFVDCNQATARMLGYATRKEFLKLHPSELSPPRQPDGRESFEKAEEMMRLAFERGFHRFEWIHRRVNGEDYPVEVSLTPIVHDGQRLLYCVWRDITGQRLLENQFRQAQKMEAVGRLAGGVAHDFNNMLGVIMGFTELAAKKVPADHSIQMHLEEIMLAAQRAADITRQLLAYARKQTVAPKVLDLNETIEGTLKMLRRLIGEDIELVWKPSKNLWPVKADPSQIDQILANLAVNARDAISGVGKITIETDNIEFDSHYCQAHAGSSPGSYAMFAVSDDGCGMSKETLEKIFEPFFTTKEVGRGTGLGLATVYGIVKQNNGFINVYGEPGLGSTFKIFLPREESQPIETRLPIQVGEVPTGSETVLLVEDEVSLLKFARTLLDELGYTVLAADRPGKALQLAREFTAEIHLLVTDVVMPKMSGRELMEKLLAQRPGLKCLFMSGYTTNVIAHHGVLDKGVQLLQKPFTRELFARKVREALSS